MRGRILNRSGQQIGRNIIAHQQAQRIEILRHGIGLAGDIGLRLTQRDLRLAQIGQQANPAINAPLGQRHAFPRWPPYPAPV
jgi:hypothetical protein